MSLDIGGTQKYQHFKSKPVIFLLTPNMFLDYLRPMITIQPIPSVHPQSLFNLLKRPWIDLSRPPMTSNDLQWPISGYFWLFLAISSYFWIFLAISGYFRLFLTVSHYVWPNVKKRQRDHLTWLNELNRAQIDPSQCPMTKGGGTAGQGGVGHHNFRSIVLDDHWSKKIYRPIDLNRVLLFIPRWSCSCCLSWNCF